MSVSSARKAFGRLAMVVLAGALAAPLTFADTVCDASSLKGAFSFRMSGSSWDSQGYLYFHGIAGRLVSDGAGALTGSSTYNYDGTVFRQTITGSYTISDDCTGTITLSGTSSGTTHYDIVLTNNGQEADVVQTDSGLTLTGSVKMQQPPTATTTTTPTTPTDPAAQRRK